MEQKNMMILIGAVVIVVGVALVAGGIWTARKHKSKPTSNQTSVLGASTQQPGTDQTPTQPAAPSGLSQSPGSNTSISETPLQASQGTPSSQSSIASLLDPTTFSKYDQYKDNQAALFIDLQKGNGDELNAGKQASVLYKGWLTNGQLFDQSQTGGDGKLQAFSFTLGNHQVISGWEQGLAGMMVGGVRLLIVPPGVGYGASGQGPIPPNSVLVFQVQLLAVQ